jgi:hypothetical protein
MRLGSKIITVVRTLPILTGVRSVWYLPDGSSVHAIEDDPIEPGTYFLTPDDTGRFKNWVIEKIAGSRMAVPMRGSLVPARKHVEVHVGNTLDDTVGCTCPGMFSTAEGVGASRTAIKQMRKVLERDAEDPPIWVLEILE